MQSLQIFHHQREEIPRLGYFPLPSTHKILGFQLDSTSLAANRLTASRYGRENMWSGAGGRPHTNTHPTKSYLTLSDVQIADGLIFHTRRSNWWLCHESGYRLSQGCAMKGWDAEEHEKMKGWDKSLLPTSSHKRYRETRESGCHPPMVLVFLT